MDRDIKEIIKAICASIPVTETDLIANLGKLVEDIDNKVYDKERDAWVCLQNTLVKGFPVIVDDWQIKAVSVLSGVSEDIIKENKTAWKAV